MKVPKVKSFALLIIFFITLISNSAFSQDRATLTGKILNGKNDPLSGVSVTIVGLPSGTSSDVEGRFTITIPASKPLTITISAVGYNEKKVTDVTVAAGKTEELNVVLDEASKKLESVVVRSSGTRRESVNALIAYQKKYQYRCPGYFCRGYQAFARQKYR